MSESAANAMMGDWVLDFFPLMFKVREKLHEQLPFYCAESIVYEHHFPRAWFYLESGGDGDGGSLVLTRRPAKMCASGSIIKSFTAPKDFVICAQVMSRNKITGEVDVHYLDNRRLHEFFVATPEQCVLSKFIRPKEDRNDVIVATWTPTVFAIERRVNNFPLFDKHLPPQKRGDVSVVSSFTEVSCCPLLSVRIRESMQKLVWMIERVEKQSVMELRLHFRHDRKMRLWILGCDVLRLETSTRTDEVRSVSIAHDSDHWQSLLRRSKLQKEAASSLNATVMESDRPQSKQGVGASVPYGVWPSFCKQKHDVEMMLEVEDEVNAILDARRRNVTSSVLTSNIGSLASRLHRTSANTKSVQGQFEPVIPLCLMDEPPPLLNTTDSVSALDKRKSCSPAKFSRFEERDFSRLKFQQRIAKRNPDVACRFHSRAVKERRLKTLDGQHNDSLVLREASRSTPASQRRTSHYLFGSMRSESRKDQPSSSPVISAGDADIQAVSKLRGLDVKQRVELHTMQKLHSTILSELREIAYQCYSAHTASAAGSKVLFELPPGCPLIAEETMLRFGFEPAHTTSSAQFFYSGTTSLVWAFDELHKAVAQRCDASEQKFLASCEKTHFL